MNEIKHNVKCIYFNYLTKTLKVKHGYSYDRGMRELAWHVSDRRRKRVSEVYKEMLHESHTWLGDHRDPEKADLETCQRVINWMVKDAPFIGK